MALTKVESEDPNLWLISDIHIYAQLSVYIWISNTHVHTERLKIIDCIDPFPSPSRPRLIFSIIN